MSLVCIVGDDDFDKDKLSEFSGFSIIKADGSAEIDCENAAVIVGHNACVNVKNALGVIVDGESFTGKVPHGIQLITCGISPKNTVSITSRTDDRLTLSLNRAIRTAKGICEPLEQPITLDKPLDKPYDEPKNEYNIMAAFAAKLLLSDNI